MSTCSVETVASVGALKVGDSLSMVALLNVPVGVWTARCDIRSKAGVLLVTIPVVLGEFVNGLLPGALYWADTSAWPVGIYVLDILVFDATIRVHTETFSLSIIPGITQ